MKYFDSREAEHLKRMISDKKLYLSKLDNSKYAYQQTQKEILFLENEILPVVCISTNIIHSEITKYVVKVLNTSLEYHCNGSLIYIPLDEKYDERPIIGVANPFYFSPKGTAGALNIEVGIQNRDGYEVPVQPLNLPIHQLL